MAGDWHLLWCAVFLGLDVGAEDCIHTGEVSGAVGLEPVDNIAVYAQVDGGLALGKGDAGIFPEVSAERGRFRGVWAGFVVAALAQGFDLTQ